ncbi:hypothetical protein FM106_08015 [Brachybacterium faecium]|nr:hypothetical protein FM106_08015 [Brachybacterium faecium]
MLCWRHLKSFINKMNLFFKRVQSHSFFFEFFLFCHSFIIVLT